MPYGNKPTENEHFVPRMYLKGFSEIKKKARRQKAYIWEFSLESMKQIPTQVNVEDICYEKNLYELKNDDGTFIAQNRIENIFADIEAINKLFFIRLSDEQINDIQYNVAVCARKWIYSRNPLTKEQLKNITEARERLPRSNPLQ